MGVPIGRSGRRRCRRPGQLVKANLRKKPEKKGYFLALCAVSVSV
jgi:hypothetical protein